MFLLPAGIAGFLAALCLHWLSWTMRLNYPSLTSITGALAAIGLTGFCLLYLTSDIASLMLIVLAIFWAVALLLGGLQAFALKASWWRGISGSFCEMALAFVTGAAVNLALQRYIQWLNRQFPGIDVYAVINVFLWGLAIPLLLLAVVRPLVILLMARSESSERG